MLSAVIAFALLSALLELLMLLKFTSAKTLQKEGFAATVHIAVTLLNLCIHWGTIVGTMTAITACLVSFATLPLAKWIKTFWENWHEQTHCNGS